MRHVLRLSPSPVRVGAAAGSLLAAALVASCSANSGTYDDEAGAVPDEAVVQDARDLLPVEVAERGVLRVAVDPASPPYVFRDPDSGEIIGFEVDLAREAAQRLGLNLEISPIAWANIIPSVQSGRYDVGMSAMGDNVEREEIVDLIDMYTEGTTITVPRTNPHGIETLGDTCGLTAAVVTGSFPVELLNAQNEHCADPVRIDEFPSQNDSVAALRSGRADFGLQTAGVAQYTYEVLPQEGQGVELTALDTNRYMLTYHAMAVDKGDPELRDAIIVALQSAVDDGTYRAVAEEWALEPNVIDTVVYNDAERFADDLLSLEGTPTDD